MNTWSHLPNSHHIDWVIESVKKDTQVWQTAWEIKAWVAARDAARDAALYAVRTATWDEARIAAWYAARHAARDAALYAARIAAWDAIFALVAYDCDQYLKMDYEKLWVYAILSEKPKAILLLPMVYVREKIKE